MHRPLAATVVLLGVCAFLFTLGPPGAAGAAERGHDFYVPPGWKVTAGVLIAPAGRSPMPAPGEKIKRPLPPKKLPGDDVRLPPQEDSPGAAVVPWDRAARHIGQRITVQGAVVVTHNIGSLCFLNFDTDWHGKFYLVVFKDVYPSLPAPPEKYFLHKTIRARGVVVLHQNNPSKPQMEIHDASMIKVVGGGKE